MYSSGFICAKTFVCHRRYRPICRCRFLHRCLYLEHQYSGFLLILVPICCMLELLFFLSVYSHVLPIINRALELLGIQLVSIPWFDVCAYNSKQTIGLDSLLFPSQAHPSYDMLEKKNVLQLDTSVMMRCF